MDGSFVDWADAHVHVMTHSLHYGLAVFEGIRCYKGKSGSAIFRLQEHVDRLFDSAHIGMMQMPFDKKQVAEAIVETVRVNRLEACYIRPLIYRGYNALGVNPFPCPVEIAILTWEWGAYLGQDALERGVDVRIASWARAAPNTFPTLAKSSANYANSQLIKMEAITEGYSEGSGQNLFIVRDDVIYTPPLTASILPGITRNSVISIAKDLGFKVSEEMLPRELLYICDEAFFVGTAVEITPIRSVDKIQVGQGARGPITTAIQQQFFDIINGKAPDRHDWLSFVYPGQPLAAVGPTAARVASR